MEVDERDSICVREVTGIGIGFIFFIYLFWDKLYIIKLSSVFPPFYQVRILASLRTVYISQIVSQLFL